MKTLEQVIDELYDRHQFGLMVPPHGPRSAVKLYADDVRRFAEACFQAGAGAVTSQLQGVDKPLGVVWELAGCDIDHCWFRMGAPKVGSHYCDCIKPGMVYALVRLAQVLKGWP